MPGWIAIRLCVIVVLGVMPCAAQPGPAARPKTPEVISAGQAEATVKPTSMERMRESIARQATAIQRRGSLGAGPSDGGKKRGVDRQMLSVRRQTGEAGLWAQDGFFSTPWPPPEGMDAMALPSPSPVVYPPLLPCDPMPEDRLSELVKTAAKNTSLPEELLEAVIEQESAKYPCALSPAGAIGLMQLMPATAALFEVENPFEPEKNVSAGARYLRLLLDRYKGDLRLALSAYNAGPSRVDAVGDVPPIPETRNYVERILKKLGLDPGPESQTP